ncbi:MULTISPECIES: hypothetical protein [Pseudofrankia]|uniref:hypothetical protein n=1 Tax=Pseudofrankia TaxID=2994363 RepID=UPI000234B3D0|nr:MULTISPECIES: hypothetical protein [Pseudofrankia]OHV39330.1 hypothetical protein BCD49_11620 [Pseudofrankia sp. EUN1h]
MDDDSTAVPVPADAEDEATAKDLNAEDAELLAALRRVATEVDPVSDRARQAARLAITFLDPDGELARLVAASGDELADAGLTGGTSASGRVDPRGRLALRAGEPTEGAPLVLSFAASDVYIDLEITGRGQQVDIVGQVVGTAESTCVIEDAGGARDVAVDTLGRFFVEGLRRGPIRLRCRSTNGATVTTAWTTV